MRQSLGSDGQRAPSTVNAEIAALHAAERTRRESVFLERNFARQRERELSSLTRRVDRELEHNATSQLATLNGGANIFSRAVQRTSSSDTGTFYFSSRLNGEGRGGRRLSTIPNPGSEPTRQLPSYTQLSQSIATPSNAARISQDRQAMQANANVSTLPTATQADPDSSLPSQTRTPTLRRSLASRVSPRHAARLNQSGSRRRTVDFEAFAARRRVAAREHVRSEPRESPDDRNPTWSLGVEDIDHSLETLSASLRRADEDLRSAMDLAGNRDDEPRDEVAETSDDHGVEIDGESSMAARYELASAGVSLDEGHLRSATTSARPIIRLPTRRPDAAAMREAEQFAIGDADRGFVESG